jgi:chromosome segregation ATPase
MLTENSNTSYCKNVTHTSNNEESLALLKIQNKKISDLYEMLDEKDTLIKQLKYNISRLESKYKQVHSILQSKNIQLHDTHEQLTQQNANQQNLYEDFGKLQILCKENASKLLKYENDVINLSNELKDIYERNKILKDKNLLLLKERTSLIENNEMLSQNAHILNNKINNLVSVLTAKENEINQLKTDNATLHHEKNMIVNNNETINQRMQYFQEKCVEIEKEKNNVLKELQIVNQKYNENVTKTNKLNEENCKMQQLQENLQKINEETNIQINQFKTKNKQLNQVLNQNNQYNNSLCSQLNKLFEMLGQEIVNFIQAFESSIKENNKIDNSKFIVSVEITDSFNDLTRSLPSSSVLLSSYDKLITFLSTMSEHFYTQKQTIKTYEHKLNLYEQITIESNNKIFDLQEETNKQNQNQQIQLQKHSDEQFQLNHTISTLRGEINMIKNLILHSLNELQQKYTEVTNITMHNSISLGDIKKNFFSKGIVQGDVKEFIFHIENINKNLIHYINLLAEENKNVVIINQEKNELKQKINMLQKEIYQLGLINEKNILDYKQSKEDIVNEFQQQLAVDMKKAKESALLEIQNLNKCLIQKDEEIKRINNNYNLLYSQYKLLQQGIKT